MTPYYDDEELAAFMAAPARVHKPLTDEEVREMMDATIITSGTITAGCIVSSIPGWDFNTKTGTFTTRAADKPQGTPEFADIYSRLLEMSAAQDEAESAIHDDWRRMHAALSGKPRVEVNPEPVRADQFGMAPIGPFTLRIGPDGIIGGHGFKLHGDGTAEFGAPATSAAAYSGARDSDWDAITAYVREPKAPEPPKPATPSRVKPAISGLGVTTPEDHRLGRWKGGV